MSEARARGSIARLPSLDGARGVLILTMLTAHLVGTRGFPRFGLAEAAGDFGYLAVIAFFVISGFLITTLLLAEVDRRGRIDLVAFYRRRLYRIFPAYYAYVAVIVAAAALGLVSVPPRDLAAAFGYVVNYVRDRAWHVGHLWSMGVEEHFYLLWPVALVAIPLADKRRLATIVAVTMILASPILRLGTLRLFPAQESIIGQSTHTVADAVAFGCLLACVRDRLWASPRYRRFLGSRAFWMVPLAAIALNRTFPHIRFFFAIGATLTDLCVALTVDRVVRFPEGLSGRFLAARPVVFLGVRSYSLYLFQQPFLHRASGASINAFPLNIALAIACGLLSYQLVELPMMRLRERRVVARSPA